MPISVQNCVVVNDGRCATVQDIVVTGSGAVSLPAGATAVRPTPAAGQLRFNSDSSRFEGFDGDNWREVGWFPRAENQLWAWGFNTCGRLGDGTDTSRCSPVQEFCSATDWAQVSASNYQTAVVKTGGTLWAWGGNFCGLLGDGTITDRCSPVQEFGSSTDWSQVSAGAAQTAAIKTSGTLWAWGRNVCGQLGDGTLTTRCSPVQEFCSASDWAQVSANGCAHIAAVKTSGTLWAWGVNPSGQLGDGTTTTRCSPVQEFGSAGDWTQVSAGNAHTTAVKSGGTLWAWGLNTCGRLGDGTLTTRCSPVQEICSAVDWSQVSAGFAHTAAVKTSGTLWAWGSAGLSGRLGDGTLTTRCSPVQEFCSSSDWASVSVGTFHTAATKTSGTLWAWGFNGSGRLGDGTTTDRCSPVQEFSSSTDWAQVSTGCHTAALKLIAQPETPPTQSQPL
jgi:alpha-tubulin suppressor-like RCC1 family protein